VRFQLIAKISDPDLLTKSMHELGTVFYMVNGHGKIVRVVYFSGSRLVDFQGELPKDLAERIEAEGHMVANIEVDEAQGYVKIVQGRGGFNYA